MIDSALHFTCTPCAPGQAGTVSNGATTPIAGAGGHPLPNQAAHSCPTPGTSLRPRVPALGGPRAATRTPSPCTHSCVYLLPIALPLFLVGDPALARVVPAPIAE